MRDLYVITVNGEPTRADTRIRTYVTERGAFEQASWLKDRRANQKIEVVRLVPFESYEVCIDDNDSR